MTFLLVIDDDIMIRAGLEMLLELEGYKVCGASNGQDALELLQKADTAPCLILLDVMMPVMDGIEFRRRQLQESHLAQVPVIVVTGRADVAEIAKLQPVAVVSKPFQTEALLKMVEAHCERKS